MISWGVLSRLAPLAFVLTRDAGLAAARAVAPFYLGLGIVVTILFFSKTGMRAADAVGALESSRELRLGLFAGWIVATMPAARLLFDTPSTFYLRAFPVPRWHFHAVTAAQLAVIELPWIALYARGAGPLAGLGAATSTIGVHAALVSLGGLGGGARRFRVEAILAAIFVAAIAGVIAIPASSAGIFAVGLVAAAITVPIAWRRAPERGASRRNARIGGHPVRALGHACLAIAWRTAPAAFSRALVVVAAGAALTTLVAHNDGVTSPPAIVALTLGMGTASLIVTLGGIVEALHAAERTASWLLASTGTSGGLRVAAAAGAAAMCGAIAGVIHGAGVAIGVGVGALTAARLVAVAAAWGAILGAASSWVERWADRGGARNGGFAVVAALGIGVAGVIGAAILGDLVVAAGAPVTAILLAQSSAKAGRRLDPPPEPGAESRA